MSEYLAALLLGFSFGNLWLCALLVFSLQTTNRSTCAGYLLGRFIAICILCALISFMGRYIALERNVLNLLSGIILLLFSFYLAATRIFNWSIPGTRKHKNEGDEPDNCSGVCKICVSEEPEFEALTRQARLAYRKTVDKESVAGFTVGMSIGAVRGASMCVKLAVLVPILLGVSVFKGLIIGVVFSLSSSIYPVLGFILGAFAVKLLAYKKWLFFVSCTFLGLFGMRYILMAL